MKKILIILLTFVAFSNAQGTITNTLGTNDDVSSFWVTNQNGDPLCQIQGDGWTGFGITPPIVPFHVVNNLDNPVGYFNNLIEDADGVGVMGQCWNTDWYGIGVHGLGSYIGTIGECSGYGGADQNYYGLYGYASTSYGLPIGVYGYSSGGDIPTGGYFEAYAGTTEGHGVYGRAYDSPHNAGVIGWAYDADPSSGLNIGVWGRATDTGNRNIGVYGDATDGTDNWAGWFDGNVNVTGNVTTQTATYSIDHPLDPGNQYLNHASVESSEMLNIYNGNVVLDNSGEATITLSDWFEALNGDFRYQLTPIGSPGPNLYVSREVNGNSFTIAGGEPGMKVSWQISGIRRDAYANANPLKVEENKTGNDIGKYINAKAYGQPESKQIGSEISSKKIEQISDKKIRELFKK